MASFASKVRPCIQSAVFSSLAEIPLFHVLNARITFGSVNKCSTEEQANTTPAATPTSTGEDEEAAGKSAASFNTKSDFAVQEVPFMFVIPDLLNLSSVQHCLRFKCALQCLRCLSVTTAAEAADTPPCPTTTRSFCSTPSIRVSWSLAQSRARSEHPALNQLTTHQSVLVSFPVLSLPLQAVVSFKCSGCFLCHCRRGFGRMLMGTSVMKCSEARVTGSNTY